MYNKLNHCRLTLHKLSSKDIPNIIALSQSVGWDYHQPELETIFESGYVFGHLNEQKTIVTSAAIIPYAPLIASIGMVIVHERYRGLGLGKIVTQQCIDFVESNTKLMLIATDEGAPLYEKMGFKTISHVHKYICNQYRTPMTEKGLPFSLTPLSVTDIEKVILLDEQAFGAHRKTLIENRIKQAKESVVVRDSLGFVIGFGMSIEGPENLLLGPIVAPTTELAIAIIDYLSKNHIGTLRIDVPAKQTVFCEILERSGFILNRRPPIMMKNTTHLPMRNEHLFGIAAQIFG